MGQIVSWWIVAPIIGFWVGGVIGRYLYPHLDRIFALRQSDGPLLAVGRIGPIPYPVRGPNTTSRELVASVLVLSIACYMAFSAGASNVANAVAPLIGSGALGLDAGILLAAAAIGLGGFTIARRTLDTVGGDLTDLPLLATLVVMVTAATITTVLSWLGIPISLALSAIMTIVGLGWGRATRVARISDVVKRKERVAVSTKALNVETGDDVPRIGEERTEDVLKASDLFDPSATARVMVLWIVSPTAAAGLSYLFFVLVPSMA